jgi:hypothetical protein
MEFVFRPVAKLFLLVPFSSEKFHKNNEVTGARRAGLSISALLNLIFEWHGNCPAKDSSEGRQRNDSFSNRAFWSYRQSHLILWKFRQIVPRDMHSQ